MNLQPAGAHNLAVVSQSDPTTLCLLLLLLLLFIIIIIVFKSSSLMIHTSDSWTSLTAHDAKLE